MPSIDTINQLNHLNQLTDILKEVKEIKSIIIFATVCGAITVTIQSYHELKRLISVVTKAFNLNPIGVNVISNTSNNDSNGKENKSYANRSNK